MKRKKIVPIVLIGVILVYVYLITFNDAFKDNIFMDYFVLILLLCTGLYMISLIRKSDSATIKTKDKLFNSVVENSNTIYIMMNSKTKELMYLSDNVEKVLGIKVKDKKKVQVVMEILNIPIIKDEIRNWNGKTEYVSQMIEYSNPGYNHNSWIKVKASLYKEKKLEYYVIQIMDATKEHDRQHLLISQATDIKARESQLNQITAKSYDMEINVDILTNSFDLRYYKMDKLYFGDEKRGNYESFINSIALEYINESDRETFLNNLSIINLKKHFNKYELNSIIFRYRLGNELKNNTWLESTIFFLSGKHKSKVSILTKNVTESAESIREQNIMLQNALNDSKNASKAKTELIATISHDIRTPLTNIMGISDSLLLKTVSSEIYDDIKNISTSSKDVLNIIDGLLDTDKIEKRIIKKEEGQYNIYKMFKRVEESAREYMGNKNIDLRINMNNNLPVILIGDYKKITQAINQIVSNSIRYTDAGLVEINVRGEKKGNLAKITVEINDTGSGIEESKLNKMMSQTDATTGLVSIKNLMKLLDGSLEIESKLNEYTKVKISYVQTIVEDNKVREMINNNKSAEVYDLTGKKILIVDDNKLNLKVTSRMLEAYKVDMTLLESGEECIEQVKNGAKYDLILLDQMMPGLDGVSTLNNLKQINNFNIPTVVLTADAMDGQRDKYISSGFDDYISKPIDKSELSRVLKKFLMNK